MRKILLILTLGAFFLTGCKQEVELTERERIAKLESQGKVVLIVEAVDGGQNDFFRYRGLDGSSNVIRVGDRLVDATLHRPGEIAIVEMVAINQGSRGALYVRNRNNEILAILIAREDVFEINLDDLLP